MSNRINAVLIALSIRMFPNTRQDPQITDEVKIRKALGEGAGKWVKHKLPDESLSPIREYAGQVRKFHYQHTCIWEDGRRLLSERARQNYDARMDEFATEYWRIVDEFGENYPRWVDQARIMHAGTFEESDYPSWSLCRQMFGFDREYSPIPNPEHFNPDMRRLYGAGLQALTDRKIEEAVAETWNRLLDPVQKLAERLSSRSEVFREALVDNIREVTALIPSLNLTGDQRLAEAARAIEEQFSNLDIATLRESKVERRATLEHAQNIVARFGGIGKRKLAA